MKPRSIAMNADSGEKTWLTPPHIIEALGPFDLDPCCPPKMPWRTAEQMVCRPDDGLAVDWTGQRVWLNPPYGREAVPFLRKMAENAAEGGVSRSSSQGRTHRRGRSTSSPSRTASSSFAVGSASTRRTERKERRLRPLLRSSRIRHGTLPVCAKAGLQGHW